MNAPRKRVIVAIVIGVPIALGVAWYLSDGMGRSRPAELPAALKSHAPRLVVEPDRIDLGRRSQCDGLVRLKARIRNASDVPTVLNDWVGSCGCTLPFGSIRRGMTIAPGESYEFEVASDSWTTSGPKSYTIDFIERQAAVPIRLTLNYIVESPLYTSHGYFLRSYDPTIDFKVASRDKQPFRVLGSEPPVLLFDPELNAPEHTLVIEWAKVAAAFGEDWLDESLAIRTDREDCPTLHLRLQGRPSMDMEIAPPEPAPADVKPASTRGG